jgi:hypothetical protein
MMIVYDAESPNMSILDFIMCVCFGPLYVLTVTLKTMFL